MAKDVARGVAQLLEAVERSAVRASRACKRKDGGESPDETFRQLHRAFRGLLKDIESLREELGIAPPSRGRE